MVLDPTGEVSETVKLNLNRKWSERKTGPSSPAIYLALAAHPEVNVWTTAPSLVVFQRVQALARAGLVLLGDVSEAGTTLPQLFEPSYDHYDLLITLSPAHIWRNVSSASLTADRAHSPAQADGSARACEPPAQL